MGTAEHNISNLGLSKHRVLCDCTSPMPMMLSLPTQYSAAAFKYDRGPWGSWGSRGSVRSKLLSQ